MPLNLGQPLLCRGFSVHDTQHDQSHDTKREIGLKCVMLWEDVVGFERPNLLEYRIVKMRPPLIKHVIGRVRLEAQGEQTAVHWTSEFKVRIPILAYFLEPKLQANFTSAFGKMLDEIEACC